MGPTLERAFHQSIDALERGERLEQVLRRFPEHAEELQGLLSVAERAMKQSSDQPSRAAQHRSRTAMLSRANKLRPSAQPKSRMPQLRWGLAVALVALFLFTAGGIGLVAASAQALPGDDLYPVKRQAERIQLSFTTGGQDRLNLTITQATRRVAEVRRLLTLGRSVEVQFEAALDSTSGALWQFAGIPVLVTGDSVVPSGLREGDVIQVSGRTTSQGWVRAYRFAAAGLTFDGRIETMKSNQWIIDGRTLTIHTTSTLDPGLRVGDLVRVRARTEGELLVAQSIMAIEPEATPVPTLIPSSVEPSATIAPTAADDDDDLEDFDLTGRLEAKEGSRWQISGRWIYLDQGTDLEGNVQLGATVRAKGTIQSDGRYLADEIRQVDDDGDELDDDGSNEEETPEAEEDSTPEPDDDDDEDPTASPSQVGDDEEDSPDDSTEVEFEGIVEAVQSGQWVVDGKTLLITSDTRIEGDPSVGDEVRVDALESSDGTLYAERIRLED